MGLWTLPPRVASPRVRHLSHHHAWIVHKGQGHAVVDEGHATVLPGTVIAVPPQSWFSLRNTGTGLLQGIWVSAPGGLERFFRALAARAGESKDDVAGFQALAQQCGMEVQPASDAASRPPGVGGGRRHRRRGGRGRRQTAAPSQPRQAPTPPVVEPPGQARGPSRGVATSPAVASSTGPSPRGDGKRHRRRRGRRGHGGRPSVTSGSTPATAPSASAPPAQATPRGPRDRRRRFGRVKEVYMGGRWVRVQGEGPVISTGE